MHSTVWQSCEQFQVTEVFSLFRHQSMSVWIGHYGSGVSVFDPEDKTIPTHVLHRPADSFHPLLVTIQSIGKKITFRFQSSITLPVRLELFDMRGKRIEAQTFSPDLHNIYSYTVKNHIATGTYLCRINSGTYSVITRLPIHFT